MKNTLAALTITLCLACGGSEATQHRVVAPRPNEIHSYYNDVLDMTTLVTDLRTTRYRTQPVSLRATMGSLYVSMGAVHLTHRLTVVPKFVSFNLTPQFNSFDVSRKLLLVNVPNGRWIKVEAEKIDNVYAAIIPLSSMEQFLDSEQSGIVGFIGESERFAQFAVNNDTCQLFKRFIERLHDTSSTARLPRRVRR